MASIAQLEDAVSHLEKICTEIHTQAKEFFPDETFMQLDSECSTILEAINSLSTSIYLAKFNNGIVSLEFQLARLQKRYQQLENYFIKDADAIVDESLLSVHYDIVQTKKEIHIKRHQEVNILLDEVVNQLLEKYQLI